MSSQESYDRIVPVPKSDRTMNLWHTFTLWIAANVVVTTVFTGMLLVPDLKFWHAMLIVLLGSLVGGIPLILTGNMGTRTGLPTMILTRGAFGHFGSALPSAVNTIVLMGWSWIQAYMGGLSLNNAIKYLTGYSNINLFVIVTEIIVVAITLYGHRMIERTENLVASLMLILSVVVFSYMFIHFHLSALTSMAVSKHPEITSMVAFDIVVATAFSWMTSSCDYNRNVKKQSTSMLGTWLGYTLATVVAMGLGAAVSGFSLLGHRPQTYDPTTLIGSINPTLGFVAGIVIFLSVISTNVMALYSASMSYLAIFPKQKFFAPTLALGVAAVLGALLKTWLTSNFENFILMVGTLFIPVSAIMLTDYYLLKRGYYNSEEIVSGAEKKYWYTGGFNLISYVVYILGAAFAYYFTYVKPLATGATILTFLVTAVLYFAIMRMAGAKVAFEGESVMGSLVD
ncbi:cytosine permease [Alicyclobacillus sp. SO9]|uniref:purine-cytosine permease family protein n=1 Tax=Alicyclobacillus sp. SO9 TaxID=2665646 RepID=UPI0018E8C1DB|nr:cytosine permease [Alicyclobacillus sp. SO9]QQE79303.1 cytosine permease [Alicyclobacillus sp. SO9]